MASIRRSVVAILVFTAFASFVGCDLFSGDSTGRVIVRMTDVPANVSAIWVSVVEIELIDTGSGDRESIEVAPAAEEFNLLDYQDGAALTVADATVDIDEFDQLRIIIGDDPSIVVDGDSTDILIASGMSSGLKFFLEYPVEMDGDTFNVLFDFHADSSLVELGPPGSPTGYVLTPVMIPESAVYNDIQIDVSEGAPALE